MQDARGLLQQPLLSQVLGRAVVGAKEITRALRMAVMPLVSSEPPSSLAALTRARRSSILADQSAVLKPERFSYFEKNEATVGAGVPGPPARQPASSKNKKRAGRRSFIIMKQK